MTGQMADNQQVLPPSRLCLIAAIEERMAELRITTRKQLAELAGCHESTISRLMSEKEHVPRLNLLHDLERVLQFPLGYLETYNNEKLQGMPVPLPSLSFGQALLALRVRRHPLLTGLSPVLNAWEPLLSEKPWSEWESGRLLPDQEQLQAIARMLELNPYERGWLFGLSGVPVEWATLEDDTRRMLQTEVDAWSYGPATSVGQPFGIFLTVNGLVRDLVNVSRDPQVLEQMRLSKPSLLQVYALTSSFAAPYLAATPGYADNYRRMIALLKSRLDPYLFRPEVVKQLQALRTANPEFARLWDLAAPSEVGTSAWDMPVSFVHIKRCANVILDFYIFWSPYLPDRRIEIMRLVPTNAEAKKFVQERQDGVTSGSAKQ